MLTLVSRTVLLPPSRPQSARKWASDWLLLCDAQDYIGLGKFVQESEGVPAHWVMQDGRSLPLEAVSYWSALMPVPMLTAQTPQDPVLDEDGYPTAGTLTQLKTWPFQDVAGWFALAKKAWHFSHFFREEETPEGTRYWLSTAGWSGNEALIRAMQAHDLLWCDTWRSSRAGGHYEFLDRKV